MVITHAEKRAWILKIRDVRESDMGWYMCQVGFLVKNLSFVECCHNFTSFLILQINTDPMKSQVGYLDVVGNWKTPILSSPFLFAFHTFLKKTTKSSDF